MRLLKMALLAVVLVQFIGVTAFAAPISFLHEGSGSGTIGGNPFNSAFRIRAMGDTANRQNYASNSFFIDHAPGTVEIELVSLSLVSTFTTATRTFMNNESTGLVGFSRAGVSGADLYNGPGNLGFWDMLSSFGPVTGGASLLQWTNSPVNTSNGVLVFNNGGTQGRFTARVGVPEPLSVITFGLGLLGLAAARRRRS